MSANVSLSTEPSSDPAALARVFHARRPRVSPSWREPASIIALWLLVISGGVLSGGALYELVVTLPLWFGAVPDSVTAWEHGSIQAPFFMIVTNGWVLMSIAVFSLSFVMPHPVRLWARIPGVIGVVILIWTIAFFIPVLVKTQGNRGAGLSGDEITRYAVQWVHWNYVRLALLAGAWLVSIRALVMVSRREMSPRLRDQRCE